MNVDKLLTRDEIAILQKELTRPWIIEGTKQMKIDLNFDGFDQTVDFFNRVARIAKKENHHPEICVSYDEVKITLSTHKAGGLTEKDFLIARQIEGEL